MDRKKIGMILFWVGVISMVVWTARTGRQVQLLGYSFLVVTGLLLCMVFGNPKVSALADLPLPSGLVINVTLSLGMLLIFIGHYLVARGNRK